MKLLTCAAVRRRLTAFHDSELSAHEQLSVAAHLDGCPPCAAEAAALDQLGAALRATRLRRPGPGSRSTGRPSRRHPQPPSRGAGQLAQGPRSAACSRTCISSGSAWRPRRRRSSAASSCSARCRSRRRAGTTLSRPSSTISGRRPVRTRTPSRLDSGVSFPSVNKDGYMPTMAITDQEAAARAVRHRHERGPRRRLRRPLGRGRPPGGEGAARRDRACAVRTGASSAARPLPST